MITKEIITRMMAASGLHAFWNGNGTNIQEARPWQARILEHDMHQQNPQEYYQYLQEEQEHYL